MIDNSVENIIRRFFTHIPMDAGFLLLALLFFGFLFRHWKLKVPAPIYYFICCLSVIFVAWIREPFDVAAGQTLTKVITDWISHCSVFAWCFLIYRLGPTLGRTSEEMHEWVQRVFGK